MYTCVNLLADEVGNDLGMILSDDGTVKTSQSNG